MVTPDYTRNRELFTSFHALQRNFAECLARHPELVRDWLAAQPRLVTEEGKTNGVSKGWRTARLSLFRRRELSALLEGAERGPEGREALARWLLAASPVRSYLEISDRARPSLGELDPEAGECQRSLVSLREVLFMANYGLAKSAVRNPACQDYDDRLSAALCGLLDAVDRYVPGPRAAQFGYFASYWIRYHLSRHAQKSVSLISFPINQQRASRKIEGYLSGRRASGEPPPSEAEVCAELGLGVDALYWHERRPRVISIHNPAGAEPDSPTMEHILCDPAPPPSKEVAEADTKACLRTLLRTCIAPDTRVMLAYAHRIGNLAEAAEDYLAQLHETICNRIGTRAARVLGSISAPPPAEKFPGQDRGRCGHVQRLDGSAARDRR